MDISNTDMTLFHLYSELEGFLAIYAAECVIAERAEAERLDIVAVQRAQSRQQDTERQWRSAIKQMAEISARATEGAFAKNSVIQLCFRYHLSEDVDVMQLVNSHVADLDRVLDADGRLSQLKQSFALLYQQRTKAAQKRKRTHNRA